MAERYDNFTVLTVGTEEKTQLYELVAFLNRSFLKKDSAIAYLKIYDVLTQTKNSKFEVLCEDYENESSYTYKSTLVNNSYKQESVEFTGDDLHKTIVIAYQVFR